MTITDHICHIIQKKRFILFCGAGISMNSGIPSVVPLLRRLLSKLGCEEDHLQQFLNSSFPFEATMENLNERTSIRSLLKIFDLNNPNANHHLIAWLAKQGFLKVIITTNFDQNIEFALSAAGLLEEKDFFVVSHFEDFKPSDYPDKIVVLKLHGTIDQPETVLTTISRIANQRNFSLMSRILQEVLQNCSYDDILFIGYSFSDHFDIRPAMMNLDVKEKNAYNIRYQPLEFPEHTEKVRADELFSGFEDATDFHCNVEHIVSSILTRFSLDEIHYTKYTEWENILDEWVETKMNTTGFTNGKIYLGYLFLASGFVTLARYYAAQTLPAADESREGKILRMLISDVTGKSFLKDPNNRDAAEAEKHYIVARDLAVELELEQYIHIYSSDLGSCHLMQQQFEKAEELFTEALGYFGPMLEDEETRQLFVEKYARTTIHLAHNFSKREMFDKAASHYEHIMPFCRNEGLNSCLELATTGYGLAHVLNGDTRIPEGLKLFIQAYPIAKIYGSIDRIRSVFFLICSWSQEIPGTIDTGDFYNREIEYIKEKTGFDRPLAEIPRRLIKDYKYK